MDTIPTTLKVQWRIGNNCNFQCGYCHPSLYSGSEPFKDYYTLKQGLINLKDSTESYQAVNIEFQGGEPTVSEDIKLLIAKPISERFTYNLHTNASADISWWASSIKYFSKLILAWHPKADDNHFKHVVELARSNNIDHVVVINAESDNGPWNRAVAMFEYFRDNRYPVQLKTLFQNYQRGNDKYMPYDDVQWDYYLKVNNIPKVQIAQAEVTLYDNYLGKLCWAGVDQIVIDYRGNMFKGWCHSSGTPMGNIYKHPVILSNTPEVCPIGICKNAFDKQAKKSNNSWGIS